jgi:hypothetical protein
LNGRKRLTYPERSGNPALPLSVRFQVTDMQPKQSRTDFWTDIIIFVGAIVVLTVSLTSAAFHWRETHDNAAVQRLTRVYSAPIVTHLPNE